LHGAQRIAVAIKNLAVFTYDGFDKLIDGVGMTRCVHPAEAGIEALVEEELSPGGGTVGVQPGIARHLQFATEIE
jgi:hypothetical protein